MNEETQLQDNKQEGISESNVVENVKTDWVEKAVEYEATPKSLREPQDKMTFIDDICKVPRATYYYEINKKETQEKIIDLCFKQAKKRTPEVLEKLGKKAEEGDNVSIGQFLEFVLEKKKKMELSADKENPFIIQFDNTFKEYGSSTSSTTDSSKE